MAVTREDVLKVAKLANIAVDEDKLESLAQEISSILGHMEELAKIDTERVLPAEGMSSGGQRLRPDHGPPDALALPPASFAPEIRDGFLIVPRLATHEGAAEPERAP